MILRATREEEFAVRDEGLRAESNRRHFFTGIAPCVCLACSRAPSSVQAADDFTSLGGALFATQMGSKASQEYEQRVYPRKQALFTHLDSSCKEVLEIGVGKGANFGLYPATRAGANVALVQGAGEELPFPDGSFDAVVATLVLCSVEDPWKVLAEVSRVLKPGGRFLFMEHVRPGVLGLVQDILDPLQGVVAAGCHLNRRTGDLILASASGTSAATPALPSAPPLFERVEPFDRFDAEGQSFLIAPHVAGVAWKKKEVA
eukprot:CAMPEP_0171750568 /NCGR_PEP_ID=MMETSP0991-20121206/41466_1 /TAXON_ID=483369 /ORGANISM="non described non described, Strain CCMP2098" /LENGTH=259 /DNA_ID=CAMNT_0012351521 /DNA_START=240 /DNA_END=1019 /DNA_ORIENTATION=-